MLDLSNKNQSLDFNLLNVSCNKGGNTSKSY